MKNNGWIFSIVFTFVILFLTIGYSAFNFELNIEDIIAYYETEDIIRITFVSVNESLNNGLSQSETFSDESVSLNVLLPEESSTVTYAVDVTNFGGTYMVLSAINNLPDNLAYSLDNYSLNKVICDDSNKCTLGITKTILLTIKYKENGYDGANTEFNLNLDFVFEEFSYYIYYDSSFSFPPEYQKVEYIESTRNQRINTTYIPKKNTTFELDLSFSGKFTSGTAGTNTFLSSADGNDSFSVNFGASQSQGNLIFPWLDKTYGSGAAIKSLSINDTIRTNRNTMKYDGKKFYYGSLSRDAVTKTQSHSTPLYLFGNDRLNFDRYEMRVYRFKLYESGELVADYIPCYRVSDGRTGLYDLVGKYFVSNVGEEEFNIGPEIDNSDFVSKYPVKKQVLKYNESTNLKLNSFLRDKYLFVNWNTKEDGSGITYADGQVVNNLTDISGTEITLYAQWLYVQLPGSGTADSPYLISNIEDWVILSSIVNSGTNSFENQYLLMNRNLDFNNDNSYANSNREDFGDINGDGVVSTIKTELTTGLGFPLIAKENSFMGTLDGGGHILSNLYIYNSSVGEKNETLTGAVNSGYLALFSRVKKGKISNLEIEGSLYTKSKVNTGVIVGLLEDGVIDKVQNHVSVTYDSASADSSVAGLVANATGNSKILSSSNHAVVKVLDTTASNRTVIGGLVANASGTLLVRDSYNAGDVLNGWRAGGIAGGVITAKATLIVDRCYNYAQIKGNLITGSGENIHVGGIVGLVWGPSGSTTVAYIINSYNLGDVTAIYSRDSGGLIGSIATRGSGYAINSYNAGKITGQNTGTMAAGLMNFSASGAIKYVLDNTFNYGSVKGKKNSYSIGYLASNSYVISNTYYNNAITGSSKTVGTGMAVADFNSQSFADQLNANTASVLLDTEFGIKLASDYGVSLCKWDLGIKGYPELKC